MADKIRAGTRASNLALVQTDMVLDALARTNSANTYEAVHIRTTGDKRQGTPEAATVDKKAWILELEKAILSEEIDFAVHSGKDVPFDIEAGTTLIPVLERANPADCFVGKLREDGTRLSFADVPEGGLVGTASLRRKASLLHLRPDLQIIEHRGNVPTRVRKLDESKELQGIILACAGVDRLEEVTVKYEAFNCLEFLPALAQGALVAQYKESRQEIGELLQAISSRTMQDIYAAERACTEHLEVDCHSVLGVFARKDEGLLKISARVLAPDGSKYYEAHRTASEEAQAQKIGLQVAKDLLEQGAAEFL